MSGIACFGMLLAEMEPLEIAKGCSAEAEAEVEAITHTCLVVKLHEHFIVLRCGSIRKSLPMASKGCSSSDPWAPPIDNSIVHVDLAGSLRPPPPEKKKTSQPHHA